MWEHFLGLICSILVMKDPSTSNWNKKLKTQRYLQDKSLLKRSRLNQRGDAEKCGFYIASTSHQLQLLEIGHHGNFKDLIHRVLFAERNQSWSLYDTDIFKVCKNYEQYNRNNLLLSTVQQVEEHASKAFW
jgi:ATP-dependent exoDNAse (exonuclease V) alpha subunit